MKKTVFLTVGAPGSGKSTWAEEQAKNPGVLVTCRDNFREMFFGGKYKYSRAKEKAVTDAMKSVIENFLQDNVFHTLIIADTNLNESTVNGYQNILNQYTHQNRKAPPPSLELVPFDVPWIELEKRNLTRGNKAVPKPVLRDFYLKMQKFVGKHKQYEPNPELPKAVIFDLDGTLANNDHRSAFEYEKLINDTPIEFVVNMAKMYKAAGYKIICVSGRNSGNEDSATQFYFSTLEWLEKNDVPFDRLFMRRHDDFRSDDIIKEEIFWAQIANEYNVECAVDDRDRVCEMWRRIGLNCLQCNWGEF